MTRTNEIRVALKEDFADSKHGGFFVFCSMIYLLACIFAIILFAIKRDLFFLLIPPLSFVSLLPIMDLATPNKTSDTNNLETAEVEQ